MSHDEDVDLAALQAKRRAVQAAERRTAPRANSRDDPDIDDDDNRRHSAVPPRRTVANSITAPAGESQKKSF